MESPWGKWFGGPWWSGLRWGAQGSAPHQFACRGLLAMLIEVPILTVATEDGDGEGVQNHADALWR